MHQIAYFRGFGPGRGRLRKQLANLFEIQFEPLERSLDSALGQHAIFDCNLDDTAYLLHLKDKLKNWPKDAKAIFVVEKTSRLQETCVLALGPTDVVHRPVDGNIRSRSRHDDLGYFRSINQSNGVLTSLRCRAVRPIRF